MFVLLAKVSGLEGAKRCLQTGSLGSLKLKRSSDTEDMALVVVRPCSFLAIAVL